MEHMDKILTYGHKCLVYASDVVDCKFWLVNPDKTHVIVIDALLKISLTACGWVNRLTKFIRLNIVSFFAILEYSIIGAKNYIFICNMAVAENGLNASLWSGRPHY